ncbi:hypothetical protein S7711_09773 [Stachybotrys chartarum IBT 7711]|uniref:DNA 3'-5' helicase n=1 Tax=Stachybotrys chartarum (strain CBS 109288 / IBT 7711) TaxID=1280523 RepID=A0A084AR89_STACB|nr:hypothetical protein S7711_09773 [Stachybotrys chartarum IBT 7711]KFA70832.1 hypothetical protein S40288_09792 [Stachybotrys chartarum IBT 40288]
MAAPNAHHVALASLNDAQRRAVTSNSSTVAILAGPGSGKTHTLTSRVVWLIQQRGYQPANVIVATFTVKAAKEMKERIGRVLGNECEKKIILGTFHSIARRYLAVYGSRIGLDPKFGIADDNDSRAIIQRICKRLDLNIEPAVARSWISKKKAKGTAALPPDPRRKTPQDHPSLITCYEAYQEQLSRSNLLDYDDLLVRCVDLLRDHPSCVGNVQTVLIDEYQDTNGIQYELMKLFAQAQKRITVVGDPDQSIYGWRSAEVRNLYRLLREFPHTAEVSLEENYRSSQSILDVSLAVIQQDKKRYKKILKPVHNKGTKPVLRMLKSSASEGEWIVAETRRLIMMFGGMLKHADVAILLRSAFLSRNIEAALGRAGISYRMIGGHKFYERKEIKVLIDYLRLVYQPENNDALARVINVPRRGVGETTIKSLLEEAENAKFSVWTLLWKHCKGIRKATTNIRIKMEQKINVDFIQVISNLQRKASMMKEDGSTTLVALIEQLIRDLNFNKYLEEEYPEDHEHRWANVQEFVSLANDFLRSNGASEEDALPEIAGIEQTKDNDVLGQFLANISLASDAQKNDKQQDQSSILTISTIHAAKGLEWPVVFVPSVYSGSIPHARADDEDEERRLLYVAMTRAQSLLYLSCPIYGSQNGKTKVDLSPFVSPFAATAFASKGPSINQALVQDAAKILRRDAPDDKKIFGKLPPMFSPEDDLFPIDPLAEDENGSGYASRAPKRQRFSNQPDGDEPQWEAPWQREYSTTMEQSSDFTVSSLPGFTTAGAHQQTLARTVSSEKGMAPLQKKSLNVETTRRPAGQKSLYGFFNKDVKAEDPQSSTLLRSNSQIRHQAALQRSMSRVSSAETTGFAERQGDILPELAQHKPSFGRKFAPSKIIKEEVVDAKRPYACFSSSPPRPSSADDAEAKVIREPSQPAAVLHSTTMSAVSTNIGVRRPAGLGPPPTLDRLRKPFKPFKPLTINRPRGPDNSNPQSNGKS